ncbi:MAG TPA: hypothetical protein VJ484_03435 [Lysobacter sp.]|nr:hypothetical protein [Lysobacter sp.]
MKPSSLIIALLLASASITACGSSQSPDAAAKQEEKSVITKAVSEAVVEARKEIREGNITISEHEKNLPKAQITPKGDLLIDGKAVAISPDQRAQLLEYRAHVAGVAESGMEIGVHGADLVTKAMGEAFKGIFSGKSEKEIEQSVEAEAAKIKMAAAKLCGRLPAMLASQQKLAAAVPEFKPYATMTQEDIDECFDDAEDRDTASMNAAEEAAAAAEKPPASN